eukprot:TRINITY_DN3039_c0_g2_i3.p1 TRINITY_DN3039_c0_g2~~TRINITY_DN3039_c0_g2_i3.p1  ORF type:complete len:402 (+),score=55.32 TRINITY_DN3039_c0_g2_i3:275-1480(+)
MRRRKINVMCLQETKWKGEKAKDLGEGFKLYYSGKSNSHNGVGIIADKDLKDKIVEVKRKNDRIMMVKIILDKEILNIISAYAPQVGLRENVKQEFWQSMDELVQGIPNSESIVIGGDFNGHVGKMRNGYERIHGGYGFGERNEMGGAILDFAVAFDLAIANTFFKKKDEHLITFKSGANRTQIDYFLVRRREWANCKDCKVIPGECLTTQHRLIVFDVLIKSQVTKKMTKDPPKIKWWELKGDKITVFKGKMSDREVWWCEGDPNEMWEQMARCLKRIAKEVLGESKGRKGVQKDTWWWNADIQKSIAEKKCFKEWQKTRTMDDLERYKLAKREAKKAVSKVKYEAYDNLYTRLGTKEGEKEIYKLAKIREKKTRDLDQVRCIRDEDQRVLVKEDEIKYR